MSLEDLSQCKDCNLVTYSPDELVKRTVIREEKGKNDLFVSRNTKTVVAIKKAQKLLVGCGASLHFLLSRNKEVTIHGLGAAMHKAIKIAQLLVSNSLGDLQMSPTTSTEVLVDDFEPRRVVRTSLCD
jgi:hypothetical protein